MDETTNVKLDNQSGSYDSLTPGPILKKGDVATMLGVTERTVDRYIADGWLRVHRLGRGPKSPMRFFQDEVLQDVRNRCFPVAPGGEA